MCLHMQDIIKSMSSVRDLVKLTNKKLFDNGSELDKEEKIKIKSYFSILFLFHFWENWMRNH